MPRLRIQRANGFVHDIDYLKGLSSEQCNLRLLSDQALYVLGNLAIEDITFYSRYGEIENNDWYLPVVEGDANSDYVLDAVSIIRRDLSMACDNVLSDISASLVALVEVGQQANQVSCDQCGSVIDDPSDDFPTIGPGETWEELSTYDTYKCKAANWIVDGFTNAFTSLDAYPIEFWTTATVSVATSIVWAALVAALIGSFVVTVVGVVIAFVAAMIAGSTFDFEEIKDMFVDKRTDLICAIYTSTSADDCRDRLGEIFDAELSAVNSAAVKLFLTNDLLNNVFVENSDIDDITPTTSCSSCCQSLYPQTVNGEAPTIVGGPTSFTATLDVSNYGVSDYLMTVRWNFDGTNYCGDMRQLKLTDITYTALDETTYKSVQIYDQIGTELYNDNDPPNPATEYCSATFTITSSTPITVEFDLGDYCT